MRGYHDRNWDYEGMLPQVVITNVKDVNCRLSGSDLMSCEIVDKRGRKFLIKRLFDAEIESASYGDKFHCIAGRMTENGYSLMCGWHEDLGVDEKELREWKKQAEISND